MHQAVKQGYLGGGHKKKALHRGESRATPHLPAQDKQVTQEDFVTPAVTMKAGSQNVCVYVICGLATVQSLSTVQLRRQICESEAGPRYHAASSCAKSPVAL